MTVGIVGAGPAGLVIAHLLQRNHIPYVLLDRSPAGAVGQQPKAGVVEYRTARLLTAENLPLEFVAENHRCEFRTPDESAVIDYARLTGGRPHYLYPQHHLVARLHETLVEAGGDLRCGQTVTAVKPGPDGVELIVTPDDGEPYTLDCDMAIGCDGSHSVVAASMPGLIVSEQRFPVRWLAVIANAPPLEPHTIYAAHPRGFAGQMRRDPEHTRYYLEVPASDTAADWPQERIRIELATRLVVGDRLDGVPFADLSFLDLRVRVARHLQDGPLYLAGDAAHLITPAGGKGMNLAIQDAVELGHGIIEHYGDDRSRLAAYSTTRLPEIWRTEAFSHWFLHVILADREAFANGLRGGWVTALRTDPLFVRWFAHAYAGVDPA